ncbi:MAG: hypothetical protein D6705_16245 [Deltaproteobacteria bacterium]|nr:MAG: hypothetical protein D6705_16245 [Deltaproteobacteria bacterium]
MTEAELAAASELPWMRVVLVGILLWLVHLWMRRLTDRLPEGAAMRRRLLRWLPLAVAVSAGAYVLWVVYVSFSWDRTLARIVMTVVLVTAVAAIWPVVADVVAGVVLRASGSCDVGDRVRVGPIAGEVVALELRTTHLETDDGERIIVPHRRLVTEPMIRAPKDEVVSHAVRLPLPEGIDAERARERLLRIAGEHHGVSVARAPTAIVGEGHVTVTFFLVLPEARASVERALREGLAALDASDPQS